MTARLTYVFQPLSTLEAPPTRGADYEFVFYGGDRPENGVGRKLVGFEMRGRGIGRDGYEVFLDGAAAGWVTSGGPAPSLNKNIGLCYLPVEHAVPGKTIQIMIRNQPVDAVTVETPFYKRAK